MISYCKSLRLERSGRKQSQRLREIASYRRNDQFSAGFDMIGIRMIFYYFIFLVMELKIATFVKGNYRKLNRKVGRW